jgi:hypothetical protein
MKIRPHSSLGVSSSTDSSIVSARRRKVGCRAEGLEMEGYLLVQHPLQTGLRLCVEEMSDSSLKRGKHRYTDTDTQARTHNGRPLAHPQL